MTAIVNPVELRRRGLEVLIRELGYSNAMRFMLQYDTGRGDYTKERYEFLPDWTVEELIHEADTLVKKGQESQQSLDPQ
jgi:hypothetical protein